MATTKIAEQLIRIENAKTIIVEKAQEMRLVYENDDGDRIEVTEKSTLDQIADAIDDINVIDPETEMNVVNNVVNFPKGYLPSPSTKSVPTAERATTTMIVSNTESDEGEPEIMLKAVNDQKTGYVIGSQQTAEKYVTQSVSGKTVTASVDGVSISKSVADGAYSVSVSKVTGDGSVAAEGGNGIGFTEANDAPTDGKHYVKVTGSGHVSVRGTAKINTAGYLEQDTTGKSTAETPYESGDATKFLVFNDVTFKDGENQPMEIPMINPLEESSITFTEGYTKNGEVFLSADLLNRLESI